MSRYATRLVLVATIAALAAVQAPAQDPPPAPKLPDGVTLIVLPPGTVKMECVVRNDKPLLRLSVGKMVIEARRLFMGDGKGALQFEGYKQGLQEGVHWVPPNGGEGPVFAIFTNEPGGTLGEEEFLTVDKLKTGSIYLMTPSLKFVFGPGAARPKKS